MDTSCQFIFCILLYILLYYIAIKTSVSFFICEINNTVSMCSSLIFSLMSIFSWFRDCNKMSSGTEDEEKERRRALVWQYKLPGPGRRDRRPSRCWEKDSRRFILRKSCFVVVVVVVHIALLSFISIIMNFPSAAQNEMAGVGVGISDDLISLEIASPEVPDLTLIDLPGIARVAVKGQPENIGEQVSASKLQRIQ